MVTSPWRHGKGFSNVTCSSIIYTLKIAFIVEKKVPSTEKRGFDSITFLRFGPSHASLVSYPCQHTDMAVCF